MPFGIRRLSERDAIAAIDLATWTDTERRVVESTMLLVGHMPRWGEGGRHSYVFAPICHRCGGWFYIPIGSDLQTELCTIEPCKEG